MKLTTIVLACAFLLFVALLGCTQQPGLQSQGSTATPTATLSAVQTATAAPTAQSYAPSEMPPVPPEATPFTPVPFDVVEEEDPNTP